MATNLKKVCLSVPVATLVLLGLAVSLTANAQSQSPRPPDSPSGVSRVTMERSSRSSSPDASETSTLDEMIDTDVQVTPRSNDRYFTSLYYEALSLGRVSTLVWFGQLRTGIRDQRRGLEVYGVVRTSGDMRTGTVSDDIIYDNYLFGGIGLDYTGLFRGLRLITQLGYAADTKSRIGLSGVDARAGFALYREIRFIPRKLREEIYSDLLYLHRYRNTIGSLQLRTFFTLLSAEISNSNRVEIGPIINIAGSIDTEKLDFNRLLEARLGARASLRGPVSFGFTPMYVQGYRWHRPTTLPSYNELRVLFTIAGEF